MRRTLTADERRFLQEKRFGVLGTVSPDGGPHLTAMWYLLEDDEVMFNTAAGRQKPENLTRDPRVSLIVPDGYRFVRVTGRARRIDDRDTTQNDIHRLALRYYDNEHKAAEAMKRFATQQRITYRVPIRGVYSSGL